MSGMAGHMTAFNSVFTCDLYQPHLRKGAGDRHYLAVGRWATVAGILLSIAGACAVTRFDGIIQTMLLVFSLVNAPALATFLLGMFWKRATGHGAFAGLVTGTLAALLHHGLTLPIDAHPGIHGGWIGVVHRYPSAMQQSFRGAIFAFTAGALMAITVSLCTRPRPESELVGLVHSLTPRPQSQLLWWQSPQTLAIAVLIAALALNILFA
jgi:SSS family solute:Na+ symporter